MIRLGYASKYVNQRGCHQNQSDYEVEAKQYKRGVWSDSNYVLPVDWKHPTTSHPGQNK